MVSSEVDPLRLFNPTSFNYGVHANKTQAETDWHKDNEELRDILAIQEKDNV